MPRPTEHIEHPGIVQKAENHRVWVMIQPQSACGSCHSKAMCGMAEVAEKIVEARVTDQKRTYQPGQQVVVKLKKSLGYKALLLGYMFPFILLISTLAITLQLTANEGLSALISILIIAPYYGILYLKREAIRGEFRFFVRD